MSKLIVFLLILTPLFNASQSKIDSLVLEKPILVKQDSVRIDLQTDISQLIQVNEESKELAKEACKLDAKTSEKLGFLVKLINKKVENDVLRSNYIR